MSQIKTKETSGVKRVNINIPTGLHNSFKAAAASQGLEMTEVLMAYIESYVAKHGYTPTEEEAAQMKRAALYLRVSTVDQHPETQLLDLRQMAAQRGLEIVAGVHGPDLRRQSAPPGPRSVDGRCPPRTLRCGPGLGL